MHALIQEPAAESGEVLPGHGIRGSGWNLIPGFGLWPSIGNAHETKFDRLLLSDGFARSRPLPNRESKTWLLHRPQFIDEDVHHC
jgi:hypothetical protein